MAFQGKPKGESRGLSFLQKARPEAIQHLLKFFGESGRHLEPKTRSLISVVTKVISASPRGLQQYVRKAMEAGASSDEIIDAVLCSYPCAGLTRVVDAMDVILDMGLPGFESAGPPSSGAAAGLSSSGWVAVAEADQLPAAGGLRVEVNSRTIALFKVNGRIAAVSGRCPHRGGSLSEGQVIGDAVTCPLHSWQFDLKDGHGLNQPDSRIAVYPVKVEEGKVWVQVEGT